MGHNYCMSHHVDIISDILAESVPTNVAGGLMPTVIGSRDLANSIRIKIHHSITHLLFAFLALETLFFQTWAVIYFTLHLRSIFSPLLFDKEGGSFCKIHCQRKQDTIDQTLYVIVGALWFLHPAI